jgi:hypothetical protein
VFVILGDLQVVLRARGLMTGRDSPVDPISGLEQFATMRDLLHRQYVWNLQQHDQKRKLVLNIAARPGPGTM